jgi:Spermine/spermidine synthase domain
MGGAAGGLFVGLLAPSVFRAYYEFPIGLALCAVVVAGVLARELWMRPAHWKAWAAVVATLVVAYVGCAGYVIRGMADGYLIAARNFYGQLRVYDLGDPATDEDSVRRFVHGIINHGEQSRREEYRRQPITYFCEGSGIGRAMRALEGRPRRIGILGLGCGTLAAYGRPGDILRIYEINSLVVDVARKQFTYLSDTPARVEVALGDGRLVLESESSQQFDILVMDAFSGDSVPVHLVTREAFETYFRHLRPGGMVAVNISNQYLNLEPVMERAAQAFGKVALVYHYSPGPGDDLLCFGCSWTLIMDPATAEAHPELRKEAKILKPERPFRVWTDDFSNMYGILK